MPKSRIGFYLASVYEMFRLTSCEKFNIIYSYF